MSKQKEKPIPWVKMAWRAVLVEERAKQMTKREKESLKTEALSFLEAHIGRIADDTTKEILRFYIAVHREQWTTASIALDYVPWD